MGCVRSPGAGVEALSENYVLPALINLPQAKMSDLSDWLPDQWKIRHVALVARLKTVPYSQDGP